MINAAPNKFRNSPFLAIWGILTHPLPKTIAFGGVATGIMNANEAESVAGTISIKG